MRSSAAFDAIKQLLFMKLPAVVLTLLILASAPAFGAVTTWAQVISPATFDSQLFIATAGTSPTTQWEQVFHPLIVGDQIPETQFVDQTGRPVKFSEYLGKTVVISFMFTRFADTDLCPATNGKFLYLQQHMDPSKFHLVSVTLDPQYDTPAILNAFAQQFGATADVWTLATGVPDAIAGFASKLGATSNSEFATYHYSSIVIVDPTGTIRTFLNDTNWSPSDLLGYLNSMRNQWFTPIGRFELGLAHTVALSENLLEGNPIALRVLVLAVTCSFGFLYLRMIRSLFSTPTNPTPLPVKKGIS